MSARKVRGLLVLAGVAIVAVVLFRKFRSAGG